MKNKPSLIASIVLLGMTILYPFLLSMSDSFNTPITDWVSSLSLDAYLRLLLLTPLALLIVSLICAAVSLYWKTTVSAVVMLAITAILSIVWFLLIAPMFF